MADRIKLKIIEVGEPKSIGEKGAKKLTFKANDGTRDATYFTFRISLFDAIKAGATLEVEAEITEREYEGNTYIDRKVNEIYIDGQAISTKAKQGRGQWGKSIEERTEIAAQVAAKEVGLCWREGKLEDNHPLVVAYRQWCLQMIATGLAPASKGGASIKSPEATSEMPREAPKSTQTTLGEMTWDTFMAIAKKGLDFEGVTQVCSALSTKDNPVKKLADWKGTKEEALNELGSLCGKDWQEVAEELESGA